LRWNDARPPDLPRAKFISDSLQPVQRSSRLKDQLGRGGAPWMDFLWETD